MEKKYNTNYLWKRERKIFPEKQWKVNDDLAPEAKIMWHKWNIQESFKQSFTP